jgi:4-alpha-glucanotransferase
MHDGTNESGAAALRELAARCGIAAESTGHGGESRPVKTATLRALLGGLGLPAAGEAEVEQSLALLSAEPWLGVLSPVQVVGANEPFEIDVRLPEGTQRVHWRVILESAQERTGATARDSLEVAARHRDGRRAIECRRLRLEALPLGYHRLEVTPGDAAMTIIAAPERCWLPSGPDERYAGVSAQLYLLRSQRNWGIGDFADLRELVSMVGARGGDVVGVNPLHSLFVDNPEHASPYGPSSRLLLNVLNIAVESVPEYSSSPRTRALVESAGFRSRLQECRDADHVDFASVGRAKLEALALLFEESCEARGARREAFERFRAAQPPAFERHCLYLALRRHLTAPGQPGSHWRDWPDSLCDSGSPQVAEFARKHARDVEREAWLQFVADEQLTDATGLVPRLRIGLYRDLAVGSDSSGAETWSDPELIAPGVEIGAPPDALSETGQNWGMPPWNPRQLRKCAYRPFVDLVRANMRHAGALRIDHAMALERLYWIPKGVDARDGAYVSYPREDLLAIVALESHRAKCIVVGEDLGTVPAGFRERMADAGMLSYRVLRFENDAGQPIRPAKYPRLALAVAGNHDLATLKGWWYGADLALLSRQGILTQEQLEAQQRTRAQEKEALVRALESERLLEAGEVSFDELRAAVHRYLGRTNAMLALAQIEDVAAQEDPVNVPNAPHYPSWRSRLPSTLEELDADGSFASVLEAVASERRLPREAGLNHAR